MVQKTEETQVTRKIWTMREELEALGVTNETAHFWWRLADRVLDLRKDCEKQSRWLIEKLERNLRALEERGVSDNALGILQSSGPELDRICGQLHEAQVTLANFAWLLASLPGVAKKDDRAWMLRFALAEVEVRS
jgi:hypothetical protein